MSNRTDHFTNRRAFTLVEMLVAMAVTLLLMAALARAFGFVGTRIRESRADTAIASSLRDVTSRLSGELSRCTVTLKPNLGNEQDQLGYLTYYEGPVTDATSSIFRAELDSDGNVTLPDSRYGDFDDYIAFTAVAQGNNWFTGKVPRYVLDQKSRELDPTFPPTPAARAFDPVVIRSKYAEIIYFASPEYVAASLPTASPSYIDVDGDLDLSNPPNAGSENGLPDRLRIYRRVLLIRPDLNLTSGFLPSQSNAQQVAFMRADRWPSAVAGLPNTGATVRSTADTSLGWLYGMAGVHQQCDLSLRRVLNDQGIPTQNVAANSLADLSQPHNRFGHVRVPNSALIGGSAALPTSMPVLALTGPATILNTPTSNNSARISPPPTPSGGPVVTPSDLSGFLRPEFVLGTDFVHHDLTGTGWGIDRLGEDVLVNNAIGFDAQIYDDQASFFTTYDTSNSPSGPVVGPSDPGYRDALTQAISRSQAGSSISQRRGGFVDLGYAVLAGGVLRGWQQRRIDRRSAADTPSEIQNTGFFLVSPFSGIRNYPTNDARLAYATSLFRSGRLVTAGTSVRLFQPAFDTFTSFYESDGFIQGVDPALAGINAGDTGVRWTIETTDALLDLGSDGIDNNRAYGADDLGEKETSPPFINRPAAIRVTVRLENPATRQVRQASVVHRDE